MRVSAKSKETKRSGVAKIFGAEDLSVAKGAPNSCSSDMTQEFKKFVAAVLNYRQPVAGVDENKNFELVRERLFAGTRVRPLPEVRADDLFAAVVGLACKNHVQTAFQRYYIEKRTASANAGIANAGALVDHLLMQADFMRCVAPGSGAEGKMVHMANHILTADCKARIVEYVVGAVAALRFADSVAPAPPSPQLPPTETRASALFERLGLLSRPDGGASVSARLTAALQDARSPGADPAGVQAAGEAAVGALSAVYLRSVYRHERHYALYKEYAARVAQWAQQVVTALRRAKAGFGPLEGTVNGSGMMEALAKVAGAAELKDSVLAEASFFGDPVTETDLAAARDSLDALYVATYVSAVQAVRDEAPLAAKHAEFNAIAQQAVKDAVETAATRDQYGAGSTAVHAARVSRTVEQLSASVADRTTDFYTKLAQFKRRATAQWDNAALRDAAKFPAICMGQWQLEAWMAMGMAGVQQPSTILDAVKALVIFGCGTTRSF